MPLQYTLAKSSSLIQFHLILRIPVGWLLVGPLKAYSLSVWRPLTIGQSWFLDMGSMYVGGGRK
jgi:hypothetical protein